MRYIELDVGAASLRDGPEPPLAPGFARVRVLACGVCGTDRDLLHGMVLPPGASYPVRPGHEVAGIVERVDRSGGAGGHLTEGDLAILHPLAPCGRCPACGRGEREQRCQAIRTLGIEDPGGFAETVAWPAARMLPANGLDPAAAALLADAAATAHNAVCLAGVPPGGRLCVLGAGGLGTGVLAVARALDPDVRLAAVVRSEASAARVEALGVEAHCGLGDAARDLRRIIGRMDAVIDFSGRPEAPAEGVALLRRGGRLVLGSLVDAPLALGASSNFMARELQVVGAYASSIDDLAAVIELTRAGRLDPGAWVSRRMALAEFEHALALAEERPDGIVRVVVECGAER
ncbi:MAG: alcohol dehydrogenase catalytic domain-containing protein [Solirubrobacteraceae bacterium]